MKSSKKGFTLIELLVVIAIIGILAGIVLTSLGSARDTAKDASASASMASARAQAELGVSSSGTYIDDLCTSANTGGIDNLITAAETQTGNTAACGQNTADGTAPGSWGAAIDLKNGDVFCVDSTGFAGVSPAASLPAAPNNNAAGEITTGYTSGDVKCSDSAS